MIGISKSRIMTSKKRYAHFSTATKLIYIIIYKYNDYLPILSILN